MIIDCDILCLMILFKCIYRIILYNFKFGISRFGVIYVCRIIFYFFILVLIKVEK